MKFKLILLSGFALVLSVGSFSSAYAELDEVEQVYVPFDFYASSTKMPAGTYNVGLDVQSDTIKVSNVSGKIGVLTLERQPREHGPRLSWSLPVLVTVIC